ncbi:NAD-dependent epimerase/dehydratase family protein [Poseidonocella sedimentorum]|uniref:Nucleoside-diphosphate-sugar epimerase n=1 Tax=Poseidonocella sedimentorum TaxID=871652 RepID=A0A1I6D908_9RHOB|nr:NAD-dependent epimerase/dehydratase family protein [Poseidonocella sedimentorum]SFR01812.1 Nucleoside-diphosphate-sugar epimerase [Poseidonocella sedimentorum]
MSGETRVLVLGASGRVGRLLRRAWFLAPPPAIRPIYQSRQPGSGPDVVWRPGAPMDDLPPTEAILALWGVTSGDDLTQNAALAREAARIASHIGARRVLHLSSAAVYGPGCDGAHEEDAPRPTTPYGRAKVAMEREVATLNGGSAHTCLRLGNVVGADSLTAALDGTVPARIDRFPTGAGPLRSYIAPGALARVLAGLLRLDAGSLPPVLNIAAPEPVRMEDLLRAAGRPFDWQPAPPGAAERATLSTDRLATLLRGALPRSTAAEMITDWREVRPR